MTDIVLEAQKREIGTKGAINQMRLGGRVPGVAYGDKESPVNLSVDTKALQAALHSERGRNALINLKIDGHSHAVLVKEIQRHAISRAIEHVDFYRVSLKKKIEAEVPVHVKGEAPGVKLGGGVLEHVVRAVKVKCLPTEIPAALDVDVSALQVGQSIKGKDIAVPQGVELLLDLEIVIVNIVAPTILEEPTTAAAGAAAPTSAEPEVIKKGKTEEGEEGAAAAGDKKAAAAPAKPEAKKPEAK